MYVYIYNYIYICIYIYIVTKCLKDCSDLSLHGAQAAECFLLQGPRLPNENIRGWVPAFEPLSEIANTKTKRSLIFCVDELAQLFFVRSVDSGHIICLLRTELLTETPTAHIMSQKLPFKLCRTDLASRLKSQRNSRCPKLWLWYLWYVY